MEDDEIIFNFHTARDSPARYAAADGVNRPPQPPVDMYLLNRPLTPSGVLPLQPIRLNVGPESSTESSHEFNNELNSIRISPESPLTVAGVRSIRPPTPLVHCTLSTQRRGPPLTRSPCGSERFRAANGSSAGYEPDEDATPPAATDAAILNLVMKNYQNY